MKYPTNKKNAYCFLVSNESRDFYLLIAYIYYLEKYQNFNVTIDFIWNAHKIYQTQPDLVILPNSRGNLYYYEVAKYCFENKILVYNNDSEGNFTPDLKYDYWGYNIEHQDYCPIHFTWNKKIKDFLIEKYKLPQENLIISGAPGFDKYAYLPQKDKKSFLEKHNLSQYNKIAGYAGWAFGKLFNPEINDILSNINKPGEIGKQWLIEQRDNVTECLRAVIEKHTDILFIFKKHPRENFESDLRDSLNEMNQLLNYPNVLYLKDQEEIQDLIQISDVWMAFESTSIMEAWLLQKPTLIINSDTNFKRQNLHEGTFIVKNPEEMTIAFNELFNLKNSTFLEPEEIIKKRKNILQEAIGYSDGLNHLRCHKAMNSYYQSSNRNNSKPNLNYKFFRLYLLLHIGKLFYIPALFKFLPKFKKTVWVFENYKLKKVHENRIKVYEHLDTFYKTNGIHDQILSEEIWEQL